MASSQMDARCYLADLLTTCARLTTDGREAELRLANINYRLLRRASSFSKADRRKWDVHTRNFTVTFWDDDHGLIPEQAVNIVHGKGARLEEVIEGTVTNVSGAEVQVAGYILHRVSKGGGHRKRLTDGRTSCHP